MTTPETWYQEPSVGNFDDDFRYWLNHSRRPALLRALEHINGFHNCASILDVGCRSAGLLFRVHQQYTKRVATDIYPPALFGGQPHVAGVEFVQGDFLELALPAFDVVACLETIEHIEPRRRQMFCDKLLATATKHLVVSIPYMWGKTNEPIPHEGYNDSHVREWFPLANELRFEIIVGHLLAVYDKEGA